MIEGAEITPYVIFMLLMVAYLPGLAAILLIPRFTALPLVTFSFLSMFLFTAVGSISVLTTPHWALGPLYSGAYVKMLFGQIILFYLVVGPYVWFRKTPVYPNFGSLELANVLRTVLTLGTLAILAYYYMKVGRFLVFDLVAGRINRVNILEFRQLTYGLPEFPVLRLGFFVFPALIAAITVAITSSRGILTGQSILLIILCMVPPLLLAEKAAILHMVVVLFVSYGLYLGDRGLPWARALQVKTVLALIVAFIPTVLVYLAYYNGPADSIQSTLDDFIFRIVGVYTEAMAASVLFVETHGFLNGVTMPNVKGLFSHERFNIEVAMHGFLAAGSEHHSQQVLKGASPIPATAEGYINFGWLGFVFFSLLIFTSIVLVQEIIIRLRPLFGAAVWALSAWYGYLAFTLMTTTIFATFVSLIHTMLAISILVFWFTMERLVRRFRS